MNKDLFTGLYTYYKANSTSAFYIATGGRFYFMTAPEDAVKPYCVYWDVGGSGPDYWFTETFEEPLFQISVYTGKSDEQIVTIGEAAKALFDLAKFTVTNWSLLALIRKGGDILFYDEERREYHYPITYCAKLQQNRA